MAHYRTPVNFSLEALEAAQNAYNKLQKFVSNLSGKGKINKEYQGKFKEKLENDLNTPQALAVVWGLVKDSEVSPEDKRITLLDFDQVLGLSLK